MEATARRVVALRPAPTLLLSLELSRKPRAPPAEPKLRVQRVYASQGWPYIPRHKSVPDASVLTQPLFGEPVNEVAMLNGLTDAPLGPVHISADLYPYTDGQGDQHMRVLALITPARLTGPHHAD